MILPVAHQAAVGRPIVGASPRVADVDAVGRQLCAAGVAARVEEGAPRRVVVPPSATHGIWLEFRQW